MGPATEASADENAAMNAVVVPMREPDHVAAQILDAVDEFIRSQVVLDEHSYALLACHVIAAQGLPAWEHMPIGWFTSEAPGSGKTSSLESISRVSLKSRVAFTSNVSEAALFRLAATQEKILLLDEADVMFGRGERSEQLRGLANACVDRGTTVYRVDATKGLGELKAFPVFASIFLAGLGKIPATLADRSIVYPLKRATAQEMKGLRPLRSREVEPVVGPLREALATWVDSHLEEFAAARPLIPAGLTPRQADNVEPLLVIADRAGGAWPSKVRNAVRTMLSGQGADANATYSVVLLEAIREVFEDKGDPEFLTTADLLRALVLLDSGPFATKYRGDLDRSNEMSAAAQRLASHVKGFGLKPIQRKEGGNVVRGYRLVDLADPIARYLSGNGVAGVTPPDEVLPALEVPEQEPLLLEPVTAATPLPVEAWPEPEGGWVPLDQIGFEKKEGMNK